MSSGRGFTEPRRVVAMCVVIAAILLALEGCAGPGAGRAGLDMSTRADREANVRLMISYDENSDGVVTRLERESDLKRQFSTVDVSHDGVLDANEMHTENDTRFKASGSSASPLFDWNQDGTISFDEFATMARSAFETLDRNDDGTLSTQELVLAPPGAERFGPGGRGPSRNGPGGGGRGPGPGGGGGGTVSWGLRPLVNSCCSERSLRS